MSSSDEVLQCPVQMLPDEPEAVGVFVAQLSQPFLCDPAGEIGKTEEKSS